MITINPEVILQSRHQVLYGRRGKERETFLRQLEKDHPIVADQDSFSVIYLDRISFIKKEHFSPNVDFGQLSMAVNEYFQASVLYNILNSMKNQVDPKLLEERFPSMFHTLTYLAGLSGVQLKSVDDVVDFLRCTRDEWEELGQQIIEIGSCFREKMPAFVQIQMLDRFQQKDALNNANPFLVIADMREDIPLLSQQAINGVLGSRCNKSLSLKLTLEPDQWKTHLDFLGNLVQSVHDYGVEELDDSYKIYTKKMIEQKKRF